MTTQTMTDDRPNRRSSIRTQLAMTAISLVVVGGVLLWLGRPAREPTTAAKTTTTTGTTDEGAPAMGGLAELYRDQERRGMDSVAPPIDDMALTDGMGHYHTPTGEVVRPLPSAPDAPPTVYLVASQEQASVVRGGIEQLNAIRATQGPPPLVGEVVAFDSAEAEVQYWAVYEANRLRDGAPGMIIDLRSGSMAACTEQEGTPIDVVRVTC
jgi:hypothetical protein